MGWQVLKKKSVTTLLLLTAFAAGGCASEPAAGEEGIVVENIRVENYFNQGVNREVFTNVPERVLVIGAAQTETLLDLGVEDAIVAAVKYEDNARFPIKQSNKEAFDALPFLSRQELNTERVLNLHPDLIISEESWYSKNKLGRTDDWNRRGTHTMVTLSSTAPAKSKEPETVEREMQYIADLGRIFHEEAQEEHIVQDTMGRLQDIRDRTADQKRPKVMILDLLSSGIVSYGKNKIAGDIATHLGAVVPDTTAVISEEELMAENPDVVFVVTYDEAEKELQQLREKPAFQHLSFIEQGHLYSIPLKYVYGPMTRIIDAAGYMGACMYPGLVSYEKEYDFHASRNE